MENILDTCKFILVNIDDIPENLRSGETNIIKFCRNLVKYSAVALTEEDYLDYFSNSNIKHEIINQYDATVGSAWWGEIRAEKSGYINGIIDGTPKTERAIISMDDGIYNSALSLMKKVAILLIDDEISLGNTKYNEGVKNLFTEANSIYDINILYEDFIGIPMPYNQALQMNLVTNNGSRIRNESGFEISVLR